MTEGSISGKGAGILIILSFHLVASFAQVYYEPLNHTLRDGNQFALRNSDSSFRYSAMRPPVLSDLTGEERSYFRTYVPSTAYDSTVFMNRKYRPYSWFRRKLLYENFIIVDTGLLYLTFDPLVNLSVGGENSESDNRFGTSSSIRDDLQNNTRGFLLRASLGRKFALESYFYESQSYLPYYASEYVNSHGVVPGQGRPKQFKEGGYDYAYSGGYFSYAPHETFNFQFGHHKHFIGDGYRSMVLSDNSFNYPFARFNFRFLKNRLRYSILYASLQDLERVNIKGPSEEIFRRKAATYHILEYSILPMLTVSLIQGTMWQTMDSNGKSDVDIEIFNPLILFNPIANGMEDVRNSLLALGLSFRPGTKSEIYGQFVLDDEKFEKVAFQAGMKHFLFNSMLLQAEYNRADAGTYSSVSPYPNSSFSHYGQALAHVLGNDFDEVLFRIAYRIKRFVPELQFNHILANKIDQHYSMSPGEVVNETINIARAEVAYLVNPATNLKIFVSFTYRKEEAGESAHLTSLIYYLGIKTDLRNVYWDF